MADTHSANCDNLQKNSTIPLNYKTLGGEQITGKFTVEEKLQPRKSASTHSHVYLLTDQSKKKFVYKCFLSKEGSSESNSYKREKEIYEKLFSKDSSQQATVYAIPRPLGFSDDSSGILLEYFPKSLEERFAPLRKHASGGDRRLIDNEILKLIYDMAAALKSLHDKGIIHTDIHEENIVFKDGQYWLIDFERAFIRDLDKGCSGKKSCPKCSDDIHKLGEVLCQAYTGDNLPEKKAKNYSAIRTNCIKNKCPNWLADLIAEMVRKRIKNGIELRNRLPAILRNEAEWLLSDQKWSELSEHYSRSVVLHRSAGRYRLGRGVLRGLDVSADGVVLAVITSTGLWLQDIEHTQLLHYEEAGYLPLTLAWTTDSDAAIQLLAIVYADKSIHIWQYRRNRESESEKEKKLEELFVLPPLPNTPLSLAWGGRKLAVGATTGDIYIWEIEADATPTYQQVRHLTTRAGAINALAWFSDNQLVFGGESGTLYLWNETNGALSPPKALVPRLDAEITGIICPDNDQIIFTTSRGIVRRYDHCTKKIIEFASKHAGSISGIRMIQKNDDAVIFATAGMDGYLGIWKASAINRHDDIDCTLPTRLFQRNSNYPIHLAVIDHGKSLSLLAGNASRGAIYQYHYILPQLNHIQVLRRLDLFDTSITALTWLNRMDDDKNVYYLAAGSKIGMVEKFMIGSITVPGQRAVSLEKLSQPEAFAIDIRVLKTDFISCRPHAIRKMTHLAHRNSVAVACSDFTIRIWDYEQQSVQTTRGNGDATGPMACHPTSDILAYATEGAGIAFYWLRAQCVSDELHPTGGYIRHLTFNAQGTQLAAISNTMTLRIIDLEDINGGYFVPGHERMVDSFYASPLTALAWLPRHHQWLVANEAGNLWTVQPDGSIGQLLQKKQSAHVTHLLSWFSKESSNESWKLAIVYSDHRIEMGNFTGDNDLKSEFGEKKNIKLLPSGHTEPITDISFSPDGQWLASSSMDGSVIIYPLT